MAKRKFRDICEICKHEFVHGYEDPVICPICKQEYNWDEYQNFTMISLSENQIEILYDAYMNIVRIQYAEGKEEPMVPSDQSHTRLQCSHQFAVFFHNSRNIQNTRGSSSELA